MSSHYRNWFSAALFTIALAGYTQFAVQPTSESSIALAGTATAIASTSNSISSDSISLDSTSEPVSSMQPVQFMSCEGIQPLLCAYINRELVNRLNRELWSSAPVKQSQPQPEVEQPEVEQTSTPTSSHLGQTLQFLVTCKNWIEDYSLLLNAPHPSQYESSIALSIEE